MARAGEPNLKHPHRFRGDVNAALNRLVGEGLISGYRTNLQAREKPERLEVTVTAGSVRMWNLEDQIRRALSELHHDVLVTIESG